MEENKFQVDKDNEDELTVELVQALMQRLAEGKTPTIDGKTYSVALIIAMSRKYSSGVVKRKNVIHTGEVLRTEGYSYSTEVVKKEDNTPVAPKELEDKPDVETKVVVKATRGEVTTILPPVNGIVSTNKVQSDAKHLVSTSPKLVEAARAIASCYSFSQVEKKWMWVMNDAYSAGYLGKAYARTGQAFAPVLTALEKHMRPTEHKRLTGNNLLEWMLANRGKYSVIILAIYAAMVKSFGDMVNFKNVKVTTSEGARTVDEVIWRRKPAPKLTISSNNTCHAVASSIEVQIAAMKFKEWMDINNGYNDGIHMTTHYDEIRAKARILSNLPINRLKLPVVLVTNDADDKYTLGAVLDSMNIGYQVRTTTTIQSLDAKNHFFIHCKPIASIGSSVKKGQIKERSKYTDAAILNTAYEQNFPVGLFFLTSYLTHHHEKGEWSDGMKDHGEISTSLTTRDGLVFRQLRSVQPLHFYPTVMHVKDVVGDMGVRVDKDAIYDYHRHLGYVLGYPMTALTYCQGERVALPAVSIMSDRQMIDTLIEVVGASEARELDEAIEQDKDKKKEKEEKKPTVKMQQPRELDEEEIDLDLGNDDDA